MAAVLTVDRVSKSFGGVRALAECSMTVQNASITGLVGPNGSGKSTLLNCISGLHRADAGRIRLGDIDVTRWKPSARAHAGMGRTFQSTRVFRQMTVAENLRAAQLLSRRSVPRTAIAEVTETFMLAPHLDKRAGSLSYGQQKLVELAMVVATNPRIALLDEPAAGVNQRLLQTIGQLLRTLRENGMTILVVEHNFPFLVNLCDTIIVLVDGREFAEGDPEYIQQHDGVLNAYLGEVRA